MNFIGTKLQLKIIRNSFVIINVTHQLHLTCLQYHLSRSGNAACDHTDD